MRTMTRVTFLDDEGEKFFGEGPCRLLHAVEQTGSLRGAAQSMGMAYTKALKLVRRAETAELRKLSERKSLLVSCGGGIVERPENCELMHENLSVMLPPNHPLASRTSVPLRELDGSTFLIITGIGFWRGLVERALPHATFIEQDDRVVFAQLARTTPHCTFVTDAPYMENDPVPGRTVVPLKDPEAHVTFYLVARANVTGLAARLFDWCTR